MASKPNIILLTADSLRADHVGGYAPERQSLTPELDEFARTSVLFREAYAPGPSTTESMPALFTGKLPCRLRPFRHSASWRWKQGLLVEGTTTFVEILRNSGYHTAGFHSNPLLSRFYGYEKGFDVFYDRSPTLGNKAPWWINAAAITLQRMFAFRPSLPADTINKKVCDWLQSAPEPFFLWIHYMDTHGPYLRLRLVRNLTRVDRLWEKSRKAPTEISTADREYICSRYESQVRFLDAEIGKLLRVFDQKGLMDRSMVVFNADHGEEFSEHGSYAHEAKLYDELLQVPLIARVPGGKPSVESGMASLVQIAPTILEFAGLPAQDGFDGSSFLPALLGKPFAGVRFIVAEAEPHDRHICIRTHDWKLIWKQGGAEKELYHLATDPDETKDLASERPGMVRDLENLLLSHQGRNGHGQLAEESEAVVALTEAQEAIIAQRLRDLGYL